MDEVHPRKPKPTRESRAGSNALGQRDRNGEAEERQPKQARKDEERGEERKRNEDEDPYRVGDEGVPAPKRLLGHDRARDDIADRDQERARGRGDDLCRARSSPHEPVDHRDRHADRECSPGIVPVETNRLTDELTDRS